LLKVNEREESLYQREERQLTAGWLAGYCLDNIQQNACAREQAVDNTN